MTVLLTETLSVRSVVKGLMGQKAEVKPRYCELVEYKQHYAILIYKIKKDNSHSPYLRVDLSSPQSMLLFEENGLFHLQPTESSDILFSFTSKYEREIWVKSIRSVFIQDDLTSSQNNNSNNNDNNNLRTQAADPLPPPANNTNNYNNNNNRSATSSFTPVPPTPPVSSSLAQTPAADNFSRNPSHQQQHSSSLSTSRSRGGALSRNLTLNEFAIGDREPTLRRRNKETTHTSILSSESDAAIPQTTLSSLNDHQPSSKLMRSDDNGSDFKTSLHLSDLSAIDGYNFNSERFHSPVDSRRAMNAEGKAKKEASSSPRKGGEDSSGTVAVLHQEIQALAMMNDQLNNALEESEKLRHEEAKAAVEQIAKLKSMLLVLDNEKDEFIRSNQSAFEELGHLRQVTREKDSLAKTVKEMKEKYDEMEEELAVLRDIKDKTRDKERALQFDLSQKEEQIEELKAQLANTSVSLIRKIEESNERDLLAISATSAKAEAESMLTNLRDQVHMLEGKLREMDVLKGDIVTKDNRIASLITELESARSEIVSGQRGEESNKSTITRLESLVREQQLFIQELSQQVEQERLRKQQLADSNMQHLGALDELAKMKIEKGDLEREKMRLKDMMLSLEKEKEAQEEKHSDLILQHKQEIENRQQEISKILDDKERLVSENQVLQRRIELMKDQHSKIMSDEEMVQKRVSLEAESFTSQIVALKNSLASSQQAYAECQLKSQKIEGELRKEHREMTNKVNELEGLVSNLKALALEKTNRVAVLEQEVDDLHLSITSERSRAQTQREEFALYQAQWNTEKRLIQHELQEIQSRYEETMTLLKRKEDHSKEVEGKLIESDRVNSLAIKEWENRCKALDQLNSNLRVDLEEIKEEYAKERFAMEERISGLQSSYQSLQLKCAELEKFYLTVQTEKQRGEHQSAMKILDLEHTLQELQGRLEDTKLQLTSRISSLQENEEIRMKLTSDLNTTRENKESLEETCSTLKEEVQKLLQTISNREMEVKERDELILSLKQDRETSELLQGDQHSLLKKRIHSLEETLLQTGESWKKTQADLQAANSQFAAKEKELHERNLLLQKAQVNIEDLNRQIRALTTGQEQLESEKVVLLENLAKREQHQLSIDEELAHVKASKEELLRNVEQLTDQLNQVNHDYRQAQRTIENMQSRISEMENNAIANNSKQIALHSELETTKQTVVDLTAEICRLKDQLQATEDRMEQESTSFLQKLQAVHNQLTNQQDQNRLKVNMLNETISEKDVLNSALEREISFLSNKIENLELSLRRAQEQAEKMVDADQVGQEILSYQSELDRHRSQQEMLYNKMLELGKKLTLSEEEKSSCLQALDRMVFSLQDNTQLVDVVNIHGGDVKEYASTVETVVSTVSSKLKQMEDYLQALLETFSVSLETVSDESKTARETEDNGLLPSPSILREQVQRLDRLQAYSTTNLIDQRLYTLRDHVKVLSQQLKTMIESKNELTQRYQETTANLEQTSSSLSSTKLSLESCRDEVDLYRVKYEKLTADYQTLQKDHKEEVHHLHSTLTNAKIQAVQEVEADFVLKRENLRLSHEKRESQLTQTIEQLNEAIDKGKQAIRELQEVKSSQEVIITNQSNEISTLSSQIVTWQEQYQQEESLLQDAQLQITTMKEELLLLQRQLDSKDRSLELLLEQKHSLEKSLYRTESDLNETQEKLQETTTRLQANLKDLQQQHDNLSMHLRLKGEELAQANSEKASLRQQLEETLKKGRESEVAAESKANDQQMEIRDLRQRYEKSQQLVSMKEQEVLRLTDEKNELSEQYETIMNNWQEDQEEHEKQLKVLQEEVKDLAHNNTKLSSKLSDREKTLEDLLMEKKTLTRQLEDSSEQFGKDEAEWTKQLQTLQIQQRDLQHAYEKQSILMASKDREINRFKEEKIFILQQLEELTSKQAESERNHSLTSNALQVELRELKIKYEKTVAHLSIREEELAVTQTAKSEVDNTLERMIRESNQREASLSQEIQKLQMENRQLNHRLDKALAQQQIQKEEIERYQTEKNSLEQQLEETLKKGRESEVAAESKANDQQMEIRDLRQRYEKSQQVVSMKEQEVLRLRDENSILSERNQNSLSRLQEEESNRLKEVNELQREVSQLKTTYEEVVIQCNKAEKELLKMSKDKMSVDHQLEDILVQYTEMESSLSKELHILQSSHRDLQHLHDKHSILLSSKERENHRLKEEKASIEKQLEGVLSRSREEEDEHARHLAGMQSENRDLKYKVDKYSNLFNTKEQELGKLLIEKNSLEQQLEETLKKGRESEVAAESKANDQQMEIRDLRQRYEKSQQVVSMKEQEVLRLTDEKNQARADLDKALNKIIQQEKTFSLELSSLKADCKSFYEEVDQLKSQLDRKTRELTRIVEDKEAMEQEMESSNASLLQKERKLQQETRELRDGLWKLQQQVDLLQLENQKLEQEVTSCQQQKVHLEESCHQLRVALEDKQKVFVGESRKTQDDLLHLQQVVERQHTALEKKDQELVTMRKELATLKEDILAKTNALSEISSEAQMNELALAKEQREKLELEKLLRKSIHRLKQQEQERVSPASDAVKPATQPLSRSASQPRARPSSSPSSTASIIMPVSLEQPKMGTVREEGKMKSKLSSEREDALAQRVQRSLSSFSERKRVEDHHGRDDEVSSHLLSRSTNSRYVHVPRRPNESHGPLGEEWNNHGNSLSASIGGLNQSSSGATNSNHVRRYPSPLTKGKTLGLKDLM
eukprot:gene8402-9261_t